MIVHFYIKTFIMSHSERMGLQNHHARLFASLQWFGVAHHYLENYTEGEGESDDHHQPGDGEEDPSQGPNACINDVRVI